MKKTSNHTAPPRENPIVASEHDIARFWDKNECFQKSIDERPKNKPFVFFDGPPFATGLPHYGHIITSTMKDIVPRFWTMRGFRVERRWGWDCHGLPVENLIEKELNLTTHEKLVEYGVDRFNEACRASVLNYAEEWKKCIRRLGRWVDMEHDYKTMDVTYMESVWWVFKQLWNQQLVYEGKKAMHICPRCTTPLSNFEVTLNYAQLHDLAVIAKFPIRDVKFLQKFCGGVDTSFIAWTTTPWSLPTTMALAVGANIKYVVVRINNQQVICAKNRLNEVAFNDTFTITHEFFGSDMLGITFEHPFGDWYKNHSNVQGNTNIYKTYATDYVTTDEGTGIVTINGAFGEIDMEAATTIGLPIVVNVSMEGKYIGDEMRQFIGRVVKPKEDTQQMDRDIADFLETIGGIFRRENIVHSYPLCWRCDTPLLNYATTSWFVRVTKIKNELLKNNENIQWVPSHIGAKRFGQWLQNARDWAVSRNRFWGTPLPLWRSADGDVLCIESREDLERQSGQRVEDLHKHIVDDIVIHKNGKEYHRIPEVLDCWFESGSVPYGQMHYPFENKEKFESMFPADFIAEGQDQTRGWFYTLHVLATALTREENNIIPIRPTAAFQNVIVNGIVLAEDGKKMSKRLKNYPDPMVVMEKYGADSLRYYLMTSSVVMAENLNFREKDVDEVYKKYMLTVWNVLAFYKMFAQSLDASKVLDAQDLPHVLDRWILTKLQMMVRDVTHAYEMYHLSDATRPLLDFVQELSTWYVRRSRSRFKGGDAHDQMYAAQTLRTVLLTFAQIAAPVTPFIAETLYQSVRHTHDPLSVHLSQWPMWTEKEINEDLLEHMTTTRTIIEQVLALRAEAGIKIRQPLASLTIPHSMDDSFIHILCDELNVKEVIVGDTLMLNTTITPILRCEGMLRECIRQTNALRKKEGYTIANRIDIIISTSSDEVRTMFHDYEEEYRAHVLAETLTYSDETQEHSLKLENNVVTISLHSILEK